MELYIETGSVTVECRNGLVLFNDSGQPKAIQINMPAHEIC